MRGGCRGGAAPGPGPWGARKIANITRLLCCYMLLRECYWLWAMVYLSFFGPFGLSWGPQAALVASVHCSYSVVRGPGLQRALNLIVLYADLKIFCTHCLHTVLIITVPYL